MMDGAGAFVRGDVLGLLTARFLGAQRQRRLQRLVEPRDVSFRSSMIIAGAANIIEPGDGGYLHQTILCGPRNDSG